MRINFCLVVYLLIAVSLIGCSVYLSQPVPTAVSPIATLNDATPSSPSSGSTRPVTWANLNLTGRLEYSRASSDNDPSVVNVETLDLVTGVINKIFTVPDDGGVYSSSA